MSNDLEYNLGLNTRPFRAAGDQAISASEHIAGQIAKKFEFRDLGRTLATALGINVEKIAEKVARLVTGISEEEGAALNQMAALSTEYANANMKYQREKLTAEQRYQLALQDRARLEEKIANRTVKTAADQVAQIQDRIALLKIEGEIKEVQSKGELQRIQDIDRMRGFNAEIKKTEDEAEAKRAEDEWNQSSDREEIRKKQVAENREQLVLEAKLISGDITSAERDRLKVLVLIAKQKEIAVQIDKTLAIPPEQRTKDDNSRLKGLFAQNEQVSKQIGLLENVANATGEIVPVAEKVGEAIGFALGKLESFVDEWTGFSTKVTTVGRGNKDLSDRELDRKISETQSDIWKRQTVLAGRVGGVGSGASGPYDAFLGPQQSNLYQAKQERDFREDVRRNVGFFGQAWTFANMPGLTENRLREIIGTATDNSRLVNLQQQTLDLLKRGIVTVPHP